MHLYFSLRQSHSIQFLLGTFIFFPPKKVSEKNIKKSHFKTKIMETITISRAEYEHLKKVELVDTELMADIAQGIKSILAGKIKEV